MAKKKITKRPSKKGMKQKQKQSQSVVVNINTTKSRPKRASSKPSQPSYRPPTQYITMQSDPSPPVIYNTPAVKQPVFEPVKTPTNSIGIQTSIPQAVPISKTQTPSKRKRDETEINLTDLYQTPDDNFQYTPIPKKTRAVLALGAEEVERRRIERNEKARLRRVEKKMAG
jgi:hypothetical protein